MPTPRLLVVDDDPKLIDFVVAALRDRDIAVDGVRSGEAALERARGTPPDAILLDIVLPGIDGLETFRRLRENGVGAPVVVVTSHGSLENAVRAMQEGAYDLLAKPVRVGQLVEAIDKLWPTTPPQQPRPVEATDEGNEAMLIGRSPAMVELYKIIGLVAPRDATVLVVGESGSGKELVARAIHRYSRRSGPFLAINCAAIPETLLESELFGHERGAFTGADRRKIGKFERAAGGTILLDEVGDMPLALQGKMLRVLEERMIERLGGTGTIPVDVRLIAATYLELPDLVRVARFREDLYFRLAAITVRVPPLRERGDDIRLLVDDLVRRLAPRVGRSVDGVAPEVYERLRGYHWPGNVRELRNVLEQALIFGRGPTLAAGDLPALVWPGRQTPPRLQRAMLDGRAPSLARVQRDHIAQLLRDTGWNQTETARRLGIHRNTVRRKIREYGLRPPP